MAHAIGNRQLYVTTALLTFFVAPAANVEIATAAPSTATAVPLKSVLRHCDFSQASVSPRITREGFASGMTAIRTTGSAVYAEIHLLNTDQPGGHYQATLIELPRPTSAGCGEGDPGTVSSEIDLDARGEATMLRQCLVEPGTTGIWVSVQRPNPHSQSPLEYYSSEFVAHL
ncbi:MULTISPECIES: hypothetical protein [unclassified Mycobacterium]|uniref:hypothetical protein n=1 Tax=unclassified Mycobacterium TaxID=2642494 RepID=UPI000A7A6143|nr:MULTISPECIES: hypothetical protein [unclassified Mycobacterium]